jgi:hypothetical protein
MDPAGWIVFGSLIFTTTDELATAAENFQEIRYSRHRLDLPCECVQAKTMRSDFSRDLTVTLVAVFVGVLR